MVPTVSERALINGYGGSARFDEAVEDDDDDDDDDEEEEEQ